LLQACEGFLELNSRLEKAEDLALDCVFLDPSRNGIPGIQAIGVGGRHVVMSGGDNANRARLKGLAQSC
jgi:hypothetical protein